MQFSASATFIAAFGLLATLAPLGTMAADCISQGGCKNCESKDSMYSFSRNFCGNTAQHYQSWGWAQATASNSDFPSSGACEDAFDNIIAQCYGQKDGGVYDYYNHLSVTFCNCESP